MHSRAARTTIRREAVLGRKRLSYLEAPADASGDRPVGALLLLHAFPLAAEMWRPQLDAMPPDWRVIAPDFRGFGASLDMGAPASTLDDYAADIIDLLDHLGIESVVMAGLSMGGYVGFALLRLAPTYCRALVLADTKTEADSEQALAGRRQMIETVQTKGVAAVAEAMLPKLLGPRTHEARPEVVALVRRLIMGNGAEGIEAAVRCMMTRPDSSALLGTLHVPGLILVGQDDQLTPVAASESMARAFPTARLEVLEGAGHLSNLEEPARFNAALTTFLKDRV